MSGTRNSRREVAAVAAALLVPVPLLAATGIHLPLPAAVERGLASVTPGGLAAPVRETAPARLGTTPAEPPTGRALPAPARGNERVALAPAAGPVVSNPSVVSGNGRTDRPQGGATEPTGALPPETGSDDAPGEDAPEAPTPKHEPAAPDAPPPTAAPAEEAVTESAVELDAGAVSTEIAVASGEVDVTVSAGDLLPPTTLPLP